MWIKPASEEQMAPTGLKRDRRARHINEGMRMAGVPEG
jgi:hypothetical protein